MECCGDMATITCGSAIACAHSLWGVVLCKRTHVAEHNNIYLYTGTLVPRFNTMLPHLYLLNVGKCCCYNAAAYYLHNISMPWLPHNVCASTSIKHLWPICGCVKIISTTHNHHSSNGVWSVLKRWGRGGLGRVNHEHHNINFPQTPQADTKKNIRNPPIQFRVRDSGVRVTRVHRYKRLCGKLVCSNTCVNFMIKPINCRRVCLAGRKRARGGW